eukprot:s1417_g4.t1
MGVTADSLDAVRSLGAQAMITFRAQVSYGVRHDTDKKQMEACLVHQKALKRLVEMYPWTESLAPDLMEEIWPGSGQRSRQTSLDAWRGAEETSSCNVGCGRGRGKRDVPIIGRSSFSYSSEAKINERQVLEISSEATMTMAREICDFGRGARASISIGLSDGMQCQDARPLFLVTEHFFTAFFALELCWRISRARLAYFMDWFNVFDAFLVLAGCLDLYVLQAVMQSHSYLRMLRLFKLARVVRLVRVTQMFRGLRLLVSACGSFLPALGWAMALLSLCMIMGGVTIGFLLQGYIEDEDHPLESRKWVWLHYGTAYRATYTMYEITMAGNWPTNVLEYVNHAYVIFFVGYITVVVFAIIRVITAIFLSQTLEAANNDVEVMIQERMRKKSMFVEQLQGIFEAIDESGDGLLSEEEMKELLADPKVQAYMESLEEGPNNGGEKRGTVVNLEDEAPNILLSVDPLVGNIHKMKQQLDKMMEAAPGGEDDVGSPTEVFEHDYQSDAAEVEGGSEELVADGGGLQRVLETILKRGPPETQNLPAEKMAKHADGGMGISEMTKLKPHIPDCLRMPWERGFAGLVLGKSPDVLMLPNSSSMKAAALMDDEPEEQEVNADSPLDLFVRSGFKPLSKDREPWKDAESDERAKLMAGWMVVIHEAGDECEAARMLDDAGETVLDDIFAKKKNGTLQVRLSAMMLYVRWCKARDLAPFPLREPQVYQYVDDLRKNRAPATRAGSFRSALAFCKGTLQLRGVDEVLERRILPVVAPSRGVSGAAWAEEFLRLRATSGLRALPGRPFMPAPIMGGGWSQSRLSTSEASNWLCEVLKKYSMEKADMSNVGAHSMKATALSWMAKAMISEKLRRLMGYHVKPKDTSLVIYSRDALAAGLDALLKVMADIRTYRFRPDLPRSQRWKNPPAGARCRSVQKLDFMLALTSAILDSVLTPSPADLKSAASLSSARSPGH